MKVLPSEAQFHGTSSRGTSHGGGRNALMLVIERCFGHAAQGWISWKRRRSTLSWPPAFETG
ncbi:unnamed protein product [Ectocarpus sp. 4 AP-2014]